MRENVVNLLQQLIKIDTRNPPGDERKIIGFIAKYLALRKIPYKVYEFRKNRQNLVCNIKSQRSIKKILFTPHVDTVPVTGKWKYGVFSGTVHKGKLYGRGATDCKANVAVCLALIDEIWREKRIFKNLDVTFAFCGDEETGSRYGIKPLMRYLKNIDYGVVLDADDFDIIVAQKGLLHLKVELFGKEAHGAFPERGINAVAKGVDVLHEIMAHAFFYKPHVLLRKPTISIGRFSGGDKVNIVAGYAFFELDIRYVPSMSAQGIIRQIEMMLKRQRIKYKITILAHQKPIEINKNMPIITILRNVLKNRRVPFNLKPSFGATVVNFLADKGIDCFAFGVGSNGQAHVKDEYVAVRNLKEGAAILRDYIEALDGNFNARQRG